MEHTTMLQVRLAIIIIIIFIFTLAALAYNGGGDVQVNIDGDCPGCRLESLDEPVIQQEINR